MSDTPMHHETRDDGGGEYEIIHIPNRLAEKVGPISIEPARLKKAEEAVARLAALYPERLVDEVRHVRDAWASMRADAQDEEAARRLRRLIHDIKGQAATFGYPLATEVASAIRGLVAGGLAALPKGPAVIEAHVNALAVIASERMSADGGKAGAVLMQGLRRTREKIGFDLPEE